MLLPQRQHETTHQKPSEVLDADEVVLNFRGILDLPQGLWLTAFYLLLQESGWLGTSISGFRFFPPSSFLWRSYYLPLHRGMTKKIVCSPVWPSQSWSFTLGRSSCSVTLPCSHMSPASFCTAVLSAYHALRCLPNWQI